LAQTLYAATIAARKEEMSRRKYARAGLAAMVCTVAAAVAIPAFAAAPNRAVQRTVGGVKFVPNRSIADTMHFQKDKIVVQKGGKITLIDKTKQPHSFSLVTPKQVPKTARGVDACFEKGACGKLAVDHGAINPETGEEQEPTTPLLDAGKAGFNQPGDSVLIPPGGKVTVNVTGGKDMSYICAIHPWMLGKIDVPPLG
jgi:plastocyanin